MFCIWGFWHFIDLLWSFCPSSKCSRYRNSYCNCGILWRWTDWHCSESKCWERERFLHNHAFTPQHMCNVDVPVCYCWQLAHCDARGHDLSLSKRWYHMFPSWCLWHHISSTAGLKCVGQDFPCCNLKTNAGKQVALFVSDWADVGMYAYSTVDTPATGLGNQSGKRFERIPLWQDINACFYVATG